MIVYLHQEVVIGNTRYYPGWVDDSAFPEIVADEGPTCDHDGCPCEGEPWREEL